MADMSLSRAIADESLGTTIGKKVRTADQFMRSVAPFSNPITALPEVADRAAGATGGFFSDLAAGYAGKPRDTGPAYDVGENLQNNPEAFAPSPEPKVITNQDVGGFGDQISKFLDKSKISDVPMGNDPTNEYARLRAPNLAPPPDARNLAINHSYGTQTKGGVFGAFANNVNKAATLADQLVQRRAGQRDFSNEIATATANAGNYDKLYDSASKRYGIRSAAEAHGLTAGVAALKNLKEVQEARLLAQRADIIQRAQQSGDFGFADLATMTTGAHNPDQITTLPASVDANGKPIGPMAISSRYGSAITPTASGAMVDAVKYAGNTAMEGKIFTDGKQRYVIKNGQKVPF